MLRVWMLFAVISMRGLLAATPGYCQSDMSPSSIKINQISLNVGNKYSIYLPTFEFSMNFQRRFDTFTSAISAAYDYRRQDMGFAMSHALNDYSVNPGVTVEDNLFFREIFSDSTGVWRRNQSIRPFLMHEMTEHSTVGLEFIIEREWSPKIRMGSKIISKHGRSLKTYYLYQKDTDIAWKNTLLYLSVEKSYRVLQGEYTFFLLEAILKKSFELNENLHYKLITSYRGNITPQPSPLFFIGGNQTLIGYENDEFWGRRTVYMKNLIELIPFPAEALTVRRLSMRRFSLLFQADIGRVSGKSRIMDMKTQNRDLKTGIGYGVGFNTDLPYMADTEVHILFAHPLEDPQDMKFYIGFGAWLN